MRYFLGVDIGGSKSHAMLANAEGRVLGFGHAGAGNHEVVGYDGLAATLQSVTRQALAAAGLEIGDIGGAGFGVAGYDWPSERPPTLEAIATLGITAPLDAVNDTIIGLLAGAEQGWGIALVAGTSNNCRGWDRYGREGRVLGNGAPFAEYGGAYEIVLKAIQAVSLDWTRRGPPTALSGAFAELVGAHDVADLLEGLSQETYTLGAAAAPLVFQVAAGGDTVAQSVIRWAGEELGSLVIGVVRQLDLQRETFDVVQVGSTYRGGPLLCDALYATVHAEAPHARFVDLMAPPVVGAVLLGMRAAGLHDPAVRQDLIASAADCLNLDS
ncbi:MAG: BadF/BadG/BcrA/BcrD ATPase family protein [Caldilineaceae bacterium]